VKDAPSIMRNDEEAVKHAEGERRQGEEVHVSHRFTNGYSEMPPHHPAQYGQRTEHTHLETAPISRAQTASRKIFW
jgi:hypothetical protein